MFSIFFGICVSLICKWKKEVSCRGMGQRRPDRGTPRGSSSSSSSSSTSSYFGTATTHESKDVKGHKKYPFCSGFSLPKKINNFFESKLGKSNRKMMIQKAKPLEGMSLGTVWIILCVKTWGNRFLIYFIKYLEKNQRLFLT
jgi:hypothetical protein